MPAIMEEKARVPKKPVLRKPYITPGFGPLALKYGSIVMGKSLKTGVVAFSASVDRKSTRLNSSH